jgi:hypothetical protein
MASIIDPFGWLLLAGTVLLVLRWKVFAVEPWVRIVVLLAVLVRSVYSLANVVAGPLFALDFDAVYAVSFHIEAVRFSQGAGISVGLINGWVYSAFVGGIYRVTGGGLLLGQQLSVLAVVFSAATTIRILRLLSVQTSRIKWVLVVSFFLPATIVYTSGTLREAFEQLFFLLTAELALKTIDHPRLKTLAMMGATVLLGASLHGGVAVGGAAVATGGVIIAGCVRAPDGVRQSLAFRRAMPAALVVVAVAGISVPTVFFPYKIGGGALSAAAEYRSNSVPARADYLRPRPGETVGTADLPIVFGLYEVSPVPWAVRTVADVVTAAEAIVRLVLVALLVLALVHAGRCGFVAFLKALLLAGGWLVIEATWSLGTTNWGTASRHHIVGYPLLVIVSALTPAVGRRRRPDHGGDERQPTSHQYGTPSLI